MFAGPQILLILITAIINTAVPTPISKLNADDDWYSDSSNEFDRIPTIQGKSDPTRNLELLPPSISSEKDELLEPRPAGKNKQGSSPKSVIKVLKPGSETSLSDYGPKPLMMESPDDDDERVTTTTTTWSPLKLQGIQDIVGKTHHQQVFEDTSKNTNNNNPLHLIGFFKNPRPPRPIQGNHHHQQAVEIVLHNVDPSLVFQPKEFIPIDASALVPTSETLRRHIQQKQQRMNVFQPGAPFYYRVPAHHGVNTGVEFYPMPHQQQMAEPVLPKVGTILDSLPPYYSPETIQNYPGCNLFGAGYPEAFLGHLPPMKFSKSEP
ncbi:unnamed protein product [Notodromas monacha]|uniref:Uncharacterized protein n=1 Tax=Notodromas monacha TaxID=399045 RepID=A0A7R9BX93_9CRUS|nr:unnamed protein product [Notodromas monacha]CAG0922301.1 unnamed protein product [Notodromas monacha]